jgi:hypothetical protein
VASNRILWAPNPQIFRGLRWTGTIPSTGSIFWPNGLRSTPPPGDLRDRIVAALDADPSALLESAFVQAERYAQGVLAGIEFMGYRYLILVSKKRLAVPGDRQAGLVRYRHVSLAVDPDTPSRESARAAAARRGKSGGGKK